MDVHGDNINGNNKNLSNIKSVCVNMSMPAKPNELVTKAYVDNIYQSCGNKTSIERLQHSKEQQKKLDNLDQDFKNQKNVLEKIAGNVTALESMTKQELVSHLSQLEKKMESIDQSLNTLKNQAAQCQERESLVRMGEVVFDVPANQSIVVRVPYAKPLPLKQSSSEPICLYDIILKEYKEFSVTHYISEKNEKEFKLNIQNLDDVQIQAQVNYRVELPTC